MQKLLYVLSISLATLLYNGVENAVTAHPEPSRRILAGDELQRLLTGNTLKGYDRAGSFWIYYTDRDTIWGKASDGDVDIGTWWVKDGVYCRTWRRWFDGTTQCWTLAVQGPNQIVWFGDREQLVGASTLEQGNSMGRSADSQLVATAADPQLDPIRASSPDPGGLPTPVAEVIAKPEAKAPVAVAITTVHLRVDAGITPVERQRIEAALAKGGYGTVVVQQMPFSISRSRVGYFREADRASAEALIAALRGTHDVVELRDYSKLIAVPEPGRLDLWIRS